ncbi:MAG TPA: VanZ family protein, partial [Rubrivivax sp.]|nr:VanZ family protein [Rubrivivax sp.]
MNPQRLPAAAPSLAPWWLLWVVFVVYGSLVPLEYRPLDWAEALARFRQIPMLDIGREGRADWIANGVLYVPVGFLTTAWLAGPCATPGRRLAALLGGIAFGAALAVAVEFTQLYFPQRTVSLNDIVAEWIGSVLGALLAWRWSDAMRRLLAAAAGAAWVSSGRLLTVYGAAYVALALFPYDLLVSAAEVAGKVDGSLWGWWLAPAGDQRELRRLAQLVAEALTVLPLGWLWARRAGRSDGASVSLAAIVGLGFGLAIELGQFFIASGISQGASVLTRAAGFALAAWLWNHRAGWTVERLRSAAGRFGGWFVAPYVLAAVAVSGWFSGPWRSVDAAFARLLGDEVRFVPFYHHYFTSESAALFSATAVALLYAPVGVLAWARHGSASAAALAALGLALLVEAGKLFPAGMRPDPTNLWIAMASAAVTAGLLGRMSQRGRWNRPGEPGEHGERGERGERGESVEPDERDPRVPREQTGRAGRAAAAVPMPSPGHGTEVPAAAGGLRLAHVVLAAALAVAAAWLAAFPVAQAAVGALLIACTALVWWRPASLFVIVPAALPLLEVAPWSGRTLFDEFDVLLLLGVSVAFVRSPAPGPRAPREPALTLLLVLLLAALAASTVRALLDWPAGAGTEAFSSLLHPLNAPRVAKGALWAVVLLALAQRLRAAGQG